MKAVVDRKKLFNPEGDDTLNARKIIKGNSTNLFNLNNVRYQWANQLYRTMMANFWIPEKVDLTQDKNDYENLTLPEREAYDGILSFLIFLDSIQTNNIPNISDHVTAPEVKNVNPISYVKIMAKIGSWTTQGVSMEMVFDLNKDIKAKDIYDTLITAWEEGCKSVYYIRTIQKNTNNISEKEECESCSG